MESQTLESMLVCSTNPQQQQQVQDIQKKPKPQTEQALKCPRCDSSNTKFCYYNNYSLTQPRYFCKSCRRYWTQGGTLRNVPVGGGCRKNKRSSSSSSISSISNSSSSNSTSKIIRTQIEKHLDHHHHRQIIPAHDDAKFQKQSNGQQMGFDGHDQISDTHMGIINLGNQMNESSSLMDFNHLYYNGEMGYNNNNLGSGAMGLNMGGQEMMIPFEELNGGVVSNIGRELGTHHENNNINNRSLLWGFPWQFGDGNNSNTTTSMGVLGDIDPRGNYWNINGIGSSWHGLLNTPLM